MNAAPVNFGILGSSRIARQGHLEQRSAAPGAVITGVASRCGERARRFAQEHRIANAYDSYEALLADRTIEGVIITLPNALHADWTLRAAAAGKHVLCEKPLATSLADAERIRTAARQHGVVIMEGFMNAMHPMHAYVDEVLASQRIGEVRTVQATLTYMLPDWKTDTRAVLALGGGSLFDAGCYCVHGVGRLLGHTPQHVMASHVVHDVTGVDEVFHAILHYKGGRTATIHASMATAFTDVCVIIGTHGRITMEGAFPGGRFPSRVVVATGSQRTERHFTGEPLHGLQLDHFARCVRGEAIPVVSLDESVRNTAILESLRQAANTGRAIPVCSP